MRKRQHLLLWLASSALIATSQPAFARCLAYEPQRVTLAGEVVQKRLPGPPNYRSVARGDRPESVYFLVLDEPVCVSADPTSRLNSQGHTGVTEVQLLISPVQGSTAAGKHMRVTGSLSSAQSAFHRTPVLLTAKGMTPG